MKSNEMERNWVIHLLVRVLVYATVLFFALFVLVGCGCRPVEMDKCYISEIYHSGNGCVYVIKCKTHRAHTHSKLYFYKNDCAYLEVTNKVTLDKIVTKK